PTIIPETAYALLWLWIFNPLYGPLNMILAALRLPAPAWLTEPSTALGAMVIMSLFQVGEGFVVVLAGLQSIPAHLKDAARVDGAGAWQTFRHVIWPMLLPWLLLLSFRDLIVALQNTFAPTFIMTYGGPYYTTTFVPLLIYEIAFDIFDLGLAAAVLIILYIMIGLLAYGIYGLLGSRHEK
ncbi:MAG: carbohydrate ABC transporter permease, partial [Candidatus Promineifilaceae bacterium]